MVEKVKKAVEDFLKEGTPGEFSIKVQENGDILCEKKISFEKKVLEKIEEEISYVSKDSGFGNVEIGIKKGKVCYIKPSKIVSVN